MIDIAEIGFAVDVSDIERAKASLVGLEKKWATAVAAITREEKLLQKAVEASSDAQQQAMSRVFGSAAKSEMNEWAAAQRNRLSMMEQSEKVAERQAAAEAKVTLLVTIEVVLPHPHDQVTLLVVKGVVNLYRMDNGPYRSL